MKHISLWSQFIRFSLSQIVIYRTDIVMRVIGIVTMAGIMIFVLMLPYQYVDGLAGWKQHEVLMVLGLYYVVNGLSWAFFRNSVSRLEEHVRLGTLDFILMKPVDSMFIVSFFDFDVTRLVDTFVGMVIVVHSAGLVGASVSLSMLLGSVIALISGLILMYCIFVCVNTLSFWTTETYLDHVVNPAFLIGKYPVDIWGEKLSTFLYWFLPVGFMSTIPAAIYLGKLPWWYSFAGLILGGIWVAGIRWLWGHAVKNYSSVGS